MKTWVEGKLHASFSSTVDRHDWSVSRPDRRVLWNPKSPRHTLDRDCICCMFLFGTFCF